MDHDRPASLSEDFAAAQGWWREAGVDCVFADQPAAWLKGPESAAGPAASASPEPIEARPEPAPSPTIGGDPAGWPTDLAAFRQWWLAEPGLDAGGSNPRIAPRGKEGAGLMVVVAQPEREDRDSLLSGPQGKLLASFLGKAGIAEEETYFASALARHAPHPDWDGLSRAGLAKVLLHHVAIARPARLVLLGNDILALIGHIPAQNPAFLLNLNQQDGSLPTLAARSLEHMLNIPSARSRFWRDWLEWTEN